MKMILFSTHCPKCNILNKKMQDKNLQYEVVEDINKMMELGIKSAPVLFIEEDNGESKQLTYFDAVKYINQI